MKFNAYKFLAATALLLISVSGEAAPRGEARPINDVYVIHFVLDGLNKSAFDSALEEGRIPAVKKYFVEGGATFENALSAFPSTSATVYQSYTSGLFPGHAGIPHLERFDRQKRTVIGYLTASGFQKINSDFINFRALTNPSVVQIDPPSTIFELLSGHPTAALYSSFRRGASYSSPKKAPVRAFWSTYITNNIEKVDLLAMRRVMKLFSKDAADIPRYTLVGLYSSDIFGHKYGPHSREVLDNLVLFDSFLNSFIELLYERGIGQKTYIIISADHGMHASGELFEFQKALEKAGVAVKSQNPRKKNYTLAVANRGVASSHIYVKHGGDFEPVEDLKILRKHPAATGTVDLIDLILNLEAVDLLIARAGDQKASVFSSGGLSTDISCYTINFSDFCSYDFDKSRGDPLEYDKNPALKDLLDGRPHSIIEWGNLTANEKYPNAVTEFSQIFRDGRAGDVFVVTKAMWGFRKAKAGNHGGAIEDDMRVPLLIAGPTISPGSFRTARTADIYPLLLEWFGIDVLKENYDGINPLREHKVDKNSEKLAYIESLFDGRPPLIKALDSEEFARKKILPAIGQGGLGPLQKAAMEELSRRAALSKEIDKLVKKFEAQKQNDGGPQIADPKYLEDHLAIARRARAWAQKSTLRMQDIAETLAR